MIDGVKKIHINEDHRLFLQGEFGGFRIYYLVTHSRAEVVPQSVRQISSHHFVSSVRFELTPGSITEHEIFFRTPIFPFADVRATRYGLFPDSFEFRGGCPSTESFPCSLSFLLHYAENCPSVPLRIEYIGIAKSAKREAQDRLGKGHEKLQKLLAEQNRRPSRQTTSIVLYRPSPLDPPILSFADVIETIEATMIQHFKPQPFNVERLNFPKDSPALSSKIKGIGARKIITEVSSPKGAKLFSNSVSQAETHVIRVSLG
ncbi:hypothetical protein I6G96_14715 [Delftia acidovorans]|uniref:hypothetical protein n=1 Tax=Delftia acidovorans TaxID=80866 RepID=UPI0018D7F920|nr:hypothetical protein [Delftia acidovorans]QPR32252.1 hypothetical protein I6G96_14715 [Delftia acidovorans]